MEEKRIDDLRLLGNSKIIGLEIYSSGGNCASTLRVVMFLD